MSKFFKKVSIGVAGLAALALGGSALAGAAGNSSSGSSTSGTSPTPSTATPTPPGEGGGPPPGFTAANAPGTAAHEAAEKPVTGEAAEKAKAAALKSVPGKAGDVTTDLRGGGYEVDVTKSDGTKVTVHLDSSFKVRTGPPGGRPGHGFGPPNGTRPGNGPPPGQPYGLQAPGT